MTILEASGITAGYRGRTVLRDCDLRLVGGELASIVGPNGAGKSTLLRVLAGVLRPARGGVRLDGHDISVLSRGELARHIAVVPQFLETLFPFTVREIVALGRTSRLGLLGRRSATDSVVVDRALGTLDLVGIADRRIDALSGGERQRAVLAMALAQEAEVLILDEPTAHLDPAHQVATLELVRGLCGERGLVGVAVLHDLNLAAALTSRIVVMSDGRIVRDGVPAAVLTTELVCRVFGPNLRVVGDDPPVVLPRANDRGRRLA